MNKETRVSQGCCDESHKGDTPDILKILEKHNNGGGGLIAILEDIQEKYGWLPEDVLRTVSEKSGRSLVDIYGVATFYRSFSLKPRGRHLICACMGTACHVRGASRLVEELERQLGIRAGETTADKEFTLETVNCLGACALGPVVVIDGHYFSKVKQSRVGQLLEETRQGFDHAEIGKDKRIFAINVSCPHCNAAAMDEGFTVDGHPSIRLKVSHNHEAGWLRLSCLYGSYSTASQFDIAAGDVVRFTCPHCDRELTAASSCSMCSAPMVRMLVCGGGSVEFCSRRGCRNHMLEVA